MFMQSFLRFIACISSICTKNGTLNLSNKTYKTFTNFDFLKITVYVKIFKAF